MSAASASKPAVVVRLESYAVAKAYSAEVLRAKLARAADARAAKVAARAEKASREFLHAKSVHEAMTSKLAAAVASLAAATAARAAKASLNRAAALDAKLRKCVAELAKVAVANAALVARHDAAKAVTAAKLSDAARRREAHMDQVIATAVRLSHKRARVDKSAVAIQVVFLTAVKAPTLDAIEPQEGAVADGNAATAAAPRWLWKRRDAAKSSDAAAGPAVPVVAGGLFSGSPRRHTPECVMEMRVEHASAKKARLLTATSNTLKGLEEGRKARTRAARMRALERSAGKRHTLRKMMASADARRAAVIGARIAAVHAHLESAKAKAALVKAARTVLATAAQTAVAC